MLKVKIFLITLLFMMFKFEVEARDVQPLFGIYKVVSNDSDDLLSQRFTQIYLTDEAQKAYPQLNKALKSYNQDLKVRARESAERYRKEAKTLRQESNSFFGSFYDNTDIIVKRADSTVLSVLEIVSNYTGGVHGMYGYFGVNFDSSTGKQLTISDICNDKNKLLNAILMRLHEDYPQSPFENAKEHISQSIEKDNLNFTIEPAGISFHFNPYEIGSYAEGLFTATLFFSEYPFLFNKHFQFLPKSYSQTLPPYHSNIISFNFGLRNFININSNDKGYCKISTGAGDVQTDLKGFNDAVLVHLDNGKNFLYIDGFIEDKGRRLYVYQISDRKIQFVNVLPYSFKNITGSSKFETWFIPTNPNSIQFDSLEKVGNSFSHFGSINEDGSFSFG